MPDTLPMIAEFPESNIGATFHTNGEATLYTHHDDPCEILIARHEVTKLGRLMLGLETYLVGRVNRTGRAVVTLNGVRVP